MPFTLGKLPLRVTMGEFRLSMAMGILPLLLCVVGLFLTGEMVNPLYALVLGFIIFFVGTAFFTSVKRGKPDSYLYDWAQNNRLAANLISPQRGLIPGQLRVILTARLGIIRKPWGGSLDDGPRTEVEVILPSNGRGGVMPKSVRPAIVSLSTKDFLMVKDE